MKMQKHDFLTFLRTMRFLDFFKKKISEVTRSPQQMLSHQLAILYTFAKDFEALSPVELSVTAKICEKRDGIQMSGLSFVLYK